MKTKAAIESRKEEALRDAISLGIIPAQASAAYFSPDTIALAVKLMEKNAPLYKEIEKRRKSQK